MKFLLALMNVYFMSHANAQPVIKIDGSSTVFPITEAMAEEFQNLKNNSVHVTAGISGTGGGFKKFCRGETDIQDASRPILKAEMQVCQQAKINYIELPIAYDAIVVAVSRDNALNEITVADLKKMWEPSAQGKITNWNQIRPDWPKQDLKLFGAGSDSGTFDFFTEAIVGKAKSSRGDYGASEDDNTIVTGIAKDKGALGYLPLSYYEANKTKLKALAIIAAGKKAILPEVKNVEDASYYLSRPIFIYVSESSLKKPEVKEFVEFYIKQSAKIAPQVKYVALPQKIYDLNLVHLAKAKTGTAFAGSEAVGLKLEDLFKKSQSGDAKSADTKKGKLVNSKKEKLVK